RCGRHPLADPAPQGGPGGPGGRVGAPGGAPPMSESVDRVRPLGALVGALEARGQLRSVVGAGGPGQPVGARPVLGVTMDSRHVRRGEVFVAVPGRVNDGHEFAAAAVAAGAAAVIVERPLPDLGVPQLVVVAARPALAQAAAWWWDDPSW